MEKWLLPLHVVFRQVQLCRSPSMSELFVIANAEDDHVCVKPSLRGVRTQCIAFEDHQWRWPQRFLKKETFLLCYHIIYLN